MKQLIIIGAGASGLICSISAKKHNPDFEVILLERSFYPGRKILVCGAGRCNITNIKLDSDLENRYHGAEISFVKEVFSQFGFDKIKDFFSDLGIEFYIERKTNIGKVFPLTNEAKTITEVLIDEAKMLGVKILLNTEAEKVSYTNSKFELQIKNLENGSTENIKSDKLIISAGGKSYPSLGSNGSGYELAKSLNHSVVFPVPSALPLVAKDPLIHLLQRQKLEIEVTSIIDNIEVKKDTDEVMFTNYGLSGPAILNISRDISIHINRFNKSSAKLKFNFFPGFTKDTLADFLENRWNKRVDQTILRSFMGIFPNRVASALLQILDLDENLKVKDLSSNDKNKIFVTLTNYQVQINSTRGWNEAEFTAGGIQTSEINPRSLSSKLNPNLYFCGEILNVDGDVGGFNLSWSWASGWVAGKLT